MALIAVSFVLLIRGSFSPRRNLAPKSVSVAASHGGAEPPIADYVHGPLSASCYGLGYVARKFGLERIPDAIYGPSSAP